MSTEEIEGQDEGKEDMSGKEGQVEADVKPEPETHSEPRHGTERMILSLHTPSPSGDSLVGSLWRVDLESITAGSADQAIRAFTDPQKKDGTFVAVPVGNFKPRPVEKEDVTIMRFKDE